MNKGIFAVLVLLLVGIILFYISRSTSFQFFGELVDRVDTERKVVALTFDDGPTKYATDEILRILDEKNVKATFYLMGQSIDENFPLAKSIVSSGHEIGNHSFSHSRMLLKSYRFIRNEIDDTDALIRESGYVGEITFRPPYGKKLFLLPYYLKQTNRQTVMWDIAPEANLGKDATTHEITEFVVNNTQPGSIILLHVMYQSRKQVMASVPEIIDQLKSEGYEFVTVSNLLSLR